MHPFRDLLFSTSEFLWSAFENIKTETVQKVIDLLKMFIPNTVTFLSTDRFRIGIGAVLWQKRCSCDDVSLTCFMGGWVICGIRSTFCSSAESNYAPISARLLLYSMLYEYHVLADRYSNRPSVFTPKNGGAAQLVRILTITSAHSGSPSLWLQMGDLLLHHLRCFLKR